jgi:tRNA threonylcarbamoyladenosine biosynthesis protein TsaB
LGLVLAIETATKVCSVALIEGNRVIDFEEQNGVYSHAENLAVFIERITKRNQIDYSDITAVAISKGPGSYTGLRIGVAFAKGFCYAQNIPLVAVDTLEIMAFGANELLGKGNYFLCPMIDARRMEVYTSIYNQHLEIKESTSAVVVEQISFHDFLERNKVYFFGDGAEKCNDIIDHKNASFELSIYPSARYFVKVINSKLINADFEDIAYFEPYYLKEFIAIKAKKLL